MKMSVQLWLKTFFVVTCVLFLLINLTALRLFNKEDELNGKYRTKQPQTTNLRHGQDVREQDMKELLYRPNYKPKLNLDYLRRLFPQNTTEFQFGYHEPEDHGFDINGDVSDIRDRLLLQLQTKLFLHRKRTKSVLVYFNDKSLTDKIFQESKCPVKNCKFKRHEKDYKNADAVLFKEIPAHLKRPDNKPDQVWIYYQLESPLHTHKIPDGIIVNWTATYRKDSVLQTPYWKFQRILNAKSRPHQHNYAKGKTKLVAWFVSNCKARNGRFEYVKELQKHVQVDIFGECGPLKCERDSRNSEPCGEMLRRDYKFYLAFENSNCNGYITEKMFTAYRYGVIPIVMGARLEDYNSISPENSFLHVDQYKTPKQLAAHMKQLSTDDAMYNTYFRWKGYYEAMNTNFMCRLCVLLESASLIQMRYRDINNWWEDGQCLKLEKDGRKNWTSWIPDTNTDIAIVDIDL